ncbi:MAG: hypothetical protein AB7O04_16185 [Hyphomonadaceae bacterium]
MNHSTFQSMRDEVSTTFDRHSEALADDLRRTRRDAGVAVEDFGDIAARSGKALVSELRETATAGHRDMRRTISQHPFASMAAAAGIGAIAALTLRAWR